MDRVADLLAEAGSRDCGGSLLMSAATSAALTITSQFVDSQSTTDCGVTVPVDVQAERNSAVTNRMAFIAALFRPR